MLGVGAVPVDEERNLGPIEGVQDANLLPAQLDTVRPDSPSPSGVTSQALFDGLDVVDCQNPAQPAPAFFGASVHCLPKRSLQGRRVIERADDLHVRTPSKGQREVASAEGRVASTIDERPAEVATDALHDVGDFAGGAGVRQVVEPHGRILPNAFRSARGGSGCGRLLPMPEEHEVAAVEPSQSEQVPQAKLDVRKSVILGVIGIVFIILIFWKVIPQIGSYSDALESLQSMTWGALVVIGVTVVIYLAVYGFAYRAAEPRLTYLQSQQVNQAAFTISNGVPAGGAVGLAVQFGMLTSFRLPPTAATAAITAVSIWSTFISLGFPIMGVVALSITGTADSVAWMGPLGLVILVVIIVLFVGIMRSAPLADRVGSIGNRLLSPLTNHVARFKDLDVSAPIRKFRTDMYDLLKRRWLWLTAAQVGISFTQFLILYAALRGVEGWDQPGTNPIAAFGAYAVSHIMLMVPITPGGLGTMDALMIQLLVSSGTDKGAATAADLVWRATSYFPQIIIGLMALVAWYRRAGQAFATRSVGAKGEEGTH